MEYYGYGFASSLHVEKSVTISVLLQIFDGPRSIDHKGTILDEVRPEVPGAPLGGPKSQAETWWNEALIY